MRRVGMFLLLLLLATVIGCGRNSATSRNVTTPVVDTSAPRDLSIKVDPKLVAATNDFGFSLYRELAKTDGSKNVFISPTSIELALAMAYNGARGDTQTEMAKAMGIGDMSLEALNIGNASLVKVLKNPDSKVHLSIANSIWLLQGSPLVDDFVRECAESYGAKVENILFNAPGSESIINRWADENTRGMIKEIVNHEDIEDAYLVLANAVYFEGEWTVPFLPYNTRDGDFRLMNGTKKRLPMMSDGGDYAYVESSRLQAIKLPYGDKSVYSIIVLPKPGVELSALTTELTAKWWSNLIGSLQGAEGSITLPRFGVECSAELKKSLKSMGMGKAFSGKEADFVGMVPEEAQANLPERVHIKDVFHKTALEVYEEGARAAAVTALPMPPGMAGMPPGKQPFVMNVDHPFIFAICDGPTGAILFLGTIVDPEKLNK